MRAVAGASLFIQAGIAMAQNSGNRWSKEKTRPHLATLVDDMDAWGSAPAVVEHTGVRSYRTSYRVLANRARSFAAVLEKRGIADGDRVVLWGRNGSSWIAAYFGCVLRGVLPVPLDAAGSSAFARQIIREVRPHLIAGDERLLAHLGSCSESTPERFYLEHLPMLPNAVALSPGPALTAESLLQIVFTSGTTGEPKGVVHTHGNLLASLGPIEREIEKYRRYERWVHPLHILHTLPLSHVFGQFMGLWIAPVLGATVHYEDRLAGSGLAELISEERIHVLAATPRTLGIMRAHLLAAEPALSQQIIDAQGESFSRRWWRFRRGHRAFGIQFWAAVCGGATLPAEVEQFWTTLGFALVQGYGLTETAALVTLNHPFKTSRGSVGKALPGRTLRVNAEGELEVQGPMVSTLTWQAGALQQRRAGREDWFATGDLAEIAEDGRLRFRGRTGQRLVTSAGLNVYLQDVEAALLQQLEVREALVLGWQAPDGGDEPAAVIAAGGGAHAVDAAIARANTSLAPHQQVRRWWLWPSLALPKTATGKVRRRQVEEWARAQAELLPLGPMQAAADPVLELLDSVAGRRGAADAPLSDETQLADGWGLDSMGQVALGAALEDRLGMTVSDSRLAQIVTIGDLRALLHGSGPRLPGAEPVPDGGTAMLDHAVHTPRQTSSPPARETALFHDAHMQAAPPPVSRYHYPRLPWSVPFRALRTLFSSGVMRPLVRLLANPSVVQPRRTTGSAPAVDPQPPMLLISNHRTAVDVPLLLYALPRGLRGKVAVAMSGEMLLGWQSSWSRRTQPAPVARHHRWWGPVAALLVQALFNVFPLPQTGGFRASFRHAGRALDRGYSVLLFPEGRRSPDGTLLPFKPGLGILALESGVPVLPLALNIAAQPAPGRRRERPGIFLGTPVTIDPSATPESITEQLRAAVASLLGPPSTAG